MPSPTIVTPNINADPGYLYYAPLATTLPANTVVGSVFTDAWASPWVWLGTTDAGSDWHYNLTTSPINAAELFDPVKIRTTARAGSVSFNLQNYTASNLAICLNGATKAVTGSTGTTLTKVTPPAPGAEVRFMLGWESVGGNIRKIAYQVINSGDIIESFKKAPANTSLPFNAQMEIPSGQTNPFDTWFAGATLG